MCLPEERGNAELPSQTPEASTWPAHAILAKQITFTLVCYTAVYLLQRAEQRVP